MTTLYRISKTTWVDEESAKEALQEWVKTHGHICGEGNGPQSCCPVAHGAPEVMCICVMVSMLESRELGNVIGQKITFIDPKDGYRHESD